MKILLLFCSKQEGCKNNVSEEEIIASLQLGRTTAFLIVLIFIQITVCLLLNYYILCTVDIIAESIWRCDFQLNKGLEQPFYMVNKNIWKILLK